MVFLERRCSASGGAGVEAVGRQRGGRVPRTSVRLEGSGDDIAYLPTTRGQRRAFSAGRCGRDGRARLAAAADVKIGSTGPLSGSFSLLGQGVRDGIQVYFDYINDQGGVNGRKIEFISEDDGYEPMRAVASAKKLVEQDNVVALVSPVGTPSDAAMVPYVEERKVPLFAPYAFSHA